MKHRKVYCQFVLTLSCLAFALAGLAVETSHKLQVNDPAVGRQILAQGGRLIADYGGYQLYETSTTSPELQASSQIETVDEYNFILLNTSHLNTRSTDLQGLRSAVGDFQGKRLHLVHFAGPVQPQWHAQLLASGVQVVSYIPQNAYLVYGDSKAIASLQQLATTAQHIQWEGAYLPEYRIHPAANPLDANGQPRALPTDQFAIQLVADDQANVETLAALGEMGFAITSSPHRVLNYLNLIVQGDPQMVLQAAARPEVVSIHPYFTPELFCERQDQIIAGNLTNNSPSGPGYLAWLASKGFTQAQFTSSGFVADITDSGLDNGTTSPNHFGLYTTGNKSNPSRVAYVRLEGRATTTNSTIKGCDGHGTINAHIVGGYNDLPNGFPHTDTAGYHYGLGVCPFVKVGGSVIFDPYYTGPNYTALQSRAYRDGARVSNNSWGANRQGAYDTAAQEYDTLVRDAQPTSAPVPNPGNQEMVIVFANGNAGSGAKTVGSPASAKNVISVGAAENVQPFGATDQCGWGDGVANNANDIAIFSSRGPCEDGRKKPDMTAPGTHVSGGVAQAPNPGANGTADSCFSGFEVCGGPTGNFYPDGQEFFTTSTGTSHSAPAVVGGCALVRQYFINNFSNPPSPAMTKAYLMNSGRYMTGAGANDALPSNNQGMGEMNLGMAFDGVPRLLRDEVAADVFTASGQSRTWGVELAVTNKPFRVTVAWTDAPGSTAGNAFNNNLDLIVTVGTTVYKGNVFNRDVSAPGGSADTRNNIESVFLPAGSVTGPISVQVLATSINSDGVPGTGGNLDQDFALVIYNGTVNPARIVSQPVSQTVVVGGTATFTVGAAGTPTLNYQWRLNGANLTGATSNRLDLVNVQTNQAGDYTVVVTNLAGGATSAVATLTTLFLAPTITTNPASQTVSKGDTAIFKSGVYGSLPIVYQWLYNGSLLPGANSTVLTLVDVTTNQAGNYSLMAVNGAGSITSSVARLTVTERLPVRVWGNNDFDQLTLSLQLTNAAAVAAGGFHSLALMKDGSVFCWGDNFDGQCSMPEDLTSAVSIAGGGYHSLAVRPNGQIRGWGADYYGQATAPPEATNAVAVAAGTFHSMALRADGSIVAWGDNSFGQTTVPPWASNIVAIAAGGEHSLALRADGTVLAWGANVGEDGTIAGQIDVPFGLEQVVAVAGGQHHSLALKTDGSVIGWGDNSDGQATTPNKLGRAVAIAAGGNHSLAVQEGGRLAAWGDNLYYQSTIGNISGAASVAAGNYHSVALLDQLPAQLQVISAAKQGNVFGVTIPTIAGKAYFLLYKAELTDPDWTLVWAQVGDGHTRTLSDSSARSEHGFYRVQQQ